MMPKGNRALLGSATYDRSEIQYRRQKYENLSNFDLTNVQMRWESFKQLIVNFIKIKTNSATPVAFWKNFNDLIEITDQQFREKFKNILIFLSIYLIAPLNSAGCERGYNTTNRIQTVARSRIKIETLYCLLNVRLLNDNIRG